MDWWFMVIYAALLLLLLEILSSAPSLPDVTAFACALSGDAASVHNYSGIHASSCPFSGDSVGGIPLVGRVSRSPEGIIVYVWVGR